MEGSFIMRQVGDATVLEVAGEIDLASAPRFRSRLIEAGRTGGRLVVDLTSVDFIDSAGLGVLVGARRRARERGGVLELVVPEGYLTGLFEATGLSAIFAIVESPSVSGKR